MAQSMRKNNNQYNYVQQHNIKDAVKTSLTESFKSSVDYVGVYRNFNFNDTYDCWIYDGNDDKKTVGNKYLQSYPYDSIKFKEGDYIHFDYYHEDKLTTWLLTSLDTHNPLEVKGEIRPCTNELRFYDNDGILRKVPIVVDDKQRSLTNQSSGGIAVNSGDMTIHAQLNDNSIKIRPNMRFLLGNKNNWTAWKVSASGINNYMNTYYDDLSSAKVLVLTLEADQVNLTSDDLENGIAYDRKPTDEAIEDNFDIPDNEDNVYEIEINPQSFDILQNTTRTYTCTLNKNGIKQDDIFVFTNETVTIPERNYEFTVIDGNTFSIKNKERYIVSPPKYVTIKCQSGDHSKIVEVTLKGVF